MADVFSKQKRSEIMRAITAKGTKPEEAVYEQLLRRTRAKVLRHVKELPGTPDIVIPWYRAIVLINGCFWHGHTCKEGKRVPKSNVAYWVKKIAGNRRRDRRTRRQLHALGWRVFVVWDCRLKARIADKTINRLWERIASK